MSFRSVWELYRLSAAFTRLTFSGGEAACACPRLTLAEPDAGRFAAPLISRKRLFGLGNDRYLPNFHIS